MGTAADPDAIWKPGFTGEVHYPSREPATVSGRGRRGRRLGIGALVVAVAGAGVARMATTAGDDPAPDPVPLRLPEAPSLRWTVELPGGVSSVGGSAGDVIVAADERNRQVIAVDATSGTERWRSDLPDGSVGQLAVIDDLVVVVVVDGDPAVIAIDAEDGDRRWERRSAPGASLIPAGGLTFIGLDGAGSQPGVTALDPATGDVIDAVEGFSGLNRSSFRSRTADVLTVHDLATLEPVGEVDLGDLDLADVDDVTAVPTAAGVAVAWQGGAALVGDDGEVVDRVSLAGPTGRAVAVTIEALDRDGRYLGVQQGERLTVLTTEDRGLSERWADDAMLLDWQAAGDGRAVLATSGVDGSIVSMPSQLVDVDTGRALGRGPSFSAGWPYRMFGTDGFVDVAPAAGSSVVVGYDLERRERWRLSTSTGSIQPVDGGLLVLDTSSQAATTLRLYA